MSREHVIPKSVCRRYDLYSYVIHLSDNLLPAHVQCNNAKRDNILFPPIHAKDNWLPEEYLSHLFSIQRMFYHLTLKILSDKEMKWKSEYWELWLSDYTDFMRNRLVGSSIFDRIKIKTEIDFN